MKETIYQWIREKFCSVTLVDGIARLFHNSVSHLRLIPLVFGLQRFIGIADDYGVHRNQVGGEM